MPQSRTWPLVSHVAPTIAGKWKTLHFLPVLHQLKLHFSQLSTQRASPVLPEIRGPGEPQKPARNCSPSLSTCYPQGWLQAGEQTPFSMLLAPRRPSRGLVLLGDTWSPLPPPCPPLLQGGDETRARGARPRSSHPFCSHQQ